MRVAQQDIRLAVLSSVAMVINFLWFDLPGHGSAFLERDLAVRAVFADGHTCFLLGMLGASMLASVAPRWLERHESWALWVSTLVGTAALAVQYAPVAPTASAVAAIATGCANIHLLIVDVLLLTHVRNRKVAGTAVTSVFVLRGVCMYGADRLLGDGGQHGLVLALPLLCTVCTVAGMRSLRCDGAAPVEGLGGPIFEKPLSTAMLGLLLLSAVAFALPCAVGATGFWGTPFALGDAGPAALLWGSVIFFAITYVTLVKTEASLLLRFIPGLLVLFAAYSFYMQAWARALDLRKRRSWPLSFLLSTMVRRSRGL